MRPRLLAVITALSAAALAAMFVLTVGSPAHAAAGFTVTNGRLYDANGTEFVMRGINHAHTWYPSQTSSFANIKATGANTVRVVLSGGRWPANSAADVANVITLCKQNRLICVLENHDTTGYGEQSGAVAAGPGRRLLDQPRRRAGRPGELRHHQHRQRADRQQRASVQPGRRRPPTAIQRLRTAGFEHTLMVDAPNWGQDWRFDDARQRGRRVRRRPRPQHRLQHPHVRRVRHRRRDHRLPRPVPHRGAADRGRRVRLQPLRRQPRRGHDHVLHAGQPASATSAGRGAATAAASSTSTW